MAMIAIKHKRHWFHCVECGREDYIDVLGSDGILIVPPGERLLCRKCDKEEDYEGDDDGYDCE